MHSVILVIQLVLALALIGVVLLQRSEGGGLTGGGGGTSGRAPQTALGKVTWGLGIAFLCASFGVTIAAALEGGHSVADRISDVPTAPAAPAPEPASSLSDLGAEDLLPAAPENTDLVPTLD